MTTPSKDFKVTDKFKELSNKAGFRGHASEMLAEDLANIAIKLIAQARQEGRKDQIEIVEALPNGTIITKWDKWNISANGNIIVEDENLPNAISKALIKIKEGK